MTGERQKVWAEIAAKVLCWAPAGKKRAPDHVYAAAECLQEASAEITRLRAELAEAQARLSQPISDAEVERAAEAIANIYQCRNCKRPVGPSVDCGCDRPDWDKPTLAIIARAALEAGR